MRLVTYQGDTGPRVAALRDGDCIDLNEVDPSLPACIKKFLELGPEAIRRAQAAIERGKPVPVGQRRLLPVIPAPEKVICVGLNYADHARETGASPPSDPIVFNKFPTALCGHGDDIVLPRASQQVDYEAELVVVIGRSGKHILPSEARDYIAGYCCGNDISARDWQTQKPGGQWLLGKSFDTFAPIGPALITADELPDPANLHIQLRLNGQVMQDSSTSQLIFSIEQLIAYVSQVCRLSPGDLLFTGTPGGVGFIRKPPVFLKPGDIVEVEIERIGVLRNRVVAE